MATLDDVYAAFLRADAAGDKETAQTLADYIRAQGVPEATPASNQNTSRWQDLRTDLGRGSLGLPGAATQLLDLPSQLTMGSTPFSDLATRMRETTGYQPSKRAKELEAQYSPQRVLSKKEIL